MSNLILVFVCLGLGLLFQRLRTFHDAAPAVLNNYVIYVALPALVLKEIPRIALNGQALIPIIVAWLVMFFAFGLVMLSAKIIGCSRNTTGALLLMCVLGNTSFVGLPLLQAHLGEAAIPYGILYDQLGTFLALNTFGIVVANACGTTGKFDKRTVYLQILRFPPFLALIVAFVLRFITYPPWANEILTNLANTLVPVVMVAVGMQWRLRPDKGHGAIIALALAIILVLKPAFALTVLQWIPADKFVSQVVVLEAAMPAMISAGALASSYQLAPRLASSIIGYSLLLSLLSVWLWRVAI